MTLTKLFEVTVNPFEGAKECSAVFLVLADAEAEARLVVDGSDRFGQIISILPQPGLVAAIGPSRIIGKFLERVA